MDRTDEDRAFTLSAEDRYIVAETTKRVTADAVPGIIAIHERHLVVNRKRLQDLDRERTAVLRAVAMREASIEALTTGRL